MARAVRLSSVTFVRPAQRLELFVNIFASSNSSATWAVCIKILGKSSNDEGVLWDRHVEYKEGMKNWLFFRSFKNGTKYGHRYNRRRIGTHYARVMLQAYV